MKIYTKTGDKGKTSLFDGTRVYKSDERVEAYGTVDELNSVIGIITSQIDNGQCAMDKDSHIKFRETLISVQNALFEIGGKLANPHVSENRKLLISLTEHTASLEQYIDEMTIEMPELTYFILPGGGMVGASLQLARTVTRRAERQIVRLSRETPVEKEILVYLNRLSDLFHTMSRYANFKENKKETIWISKII